MRTALEAAGVRASSVLLVTGRGVAAVKGLGRPRILLSPDVVACLDADELLAVLLHEETHRRRRDTLMSAVAWGVQTVYFFYPPAWWLVRRLRVAAETLCDEAVLRRGVRPETYARAVARVVAANLGTWRPIAPAEVALGHGSALRERLDRIENAWRYRVMKRHRWLVVVSAVVFVGALAVPLLGAAARGAAAAEESRPEAASGRGLDKLVGIRSPVTLSLREATLETAFRELAGATSIRFRLEEGLDGKVSLVATQIPARKVLAQLARDQRLEYVVVDAWTVAVRRAPPAVRVAGVGGVTNPRLIEASKVQPGFPADAREARVDGTTIFQALIRADGTVGALELLNQSRPEYGFAASAEEAIRQWRYEPATEDGVAVDAYFTIFVEFRLEE